MNARYRIEFAPRAARQFRKLPSNVQQRLRPAIDKLAENPRPPGSERIQGQDLYRVRVGDYRVVYEVRDQVLVVLITKVGHRREVYRRW